jgi:DNA modification methylase
MRVEKLSDDVTLYCGDCLEVMAELEANSVDAVITDPPYGIGDIWKGGSSHGWGVASLATPKRNEWDVKPAKEYFDEILRIANKVIIWGGNYFELPTSRGWLVWSKPERNFTLSEAELAWTNIPMPIRVIDYHRSDSGREHPTQKPVGVMRFSIEKAKLPEGATILDPFMGSGTTGVAAVQLGRRFIGIEIDETYYEIAKKRIQQAMLQMRMEL